MKPFVAFVTLNRLGPIIRKVAHTINIHCLDARGSHKSSLSSDGKGHQVLHLKAGHEMFYLPFHSVCGDKKARYCQRFEISTTSSLSLASRFAVDPAG